MELARGEDRVLLQPGQMAPPFEFSEVQANHILETLGSEDLPKERYYSRAFHEGRLSEEQIGKRQVYTNRSRAAPLLQGQVRDKGAFAASLLQITNPIWGKSTADPRSW